MKVLLLGEFSGFHSHLKKGLEELGITCDLASTGDNWKKIPGTNISLYKFKNSGALSRIINHNILPILSVSRFFDYDVVQLVNPRIFADRINLYMFKMIKKHSKKTFVSVSGGCHSLFDSYKKGYFEYYIFDDNIKTTSVYDLKSRRSRITKKTEEYIYNHVDGIIPIMYEYAVGVKCRKNCMPTIPLPFDSSCVTYKPNIVKDKIVICHGILKEESKGSAYIKDALKIIKERHPDEVEILIDGKMPLEDYIEWLSKANILVDQCKEHCYGMNALYAMAMGKIVLGGASENSVKEFGLNSCPVYHISPNVEVIVSQLEHVISKKENFEKMGLESRKYVEKVHNHKKIAKMYLDSWTNLSK